MAERPLDLGWMRVFDAVARLGSLTAAAGELGLSQPAVSAAIRTLEEAVGAPLLVRGHRGSTLSAAGAALHRAVRPAVADLDAAVREIRARTRRPVVRLFTDYGFASFWMMPRVADFRAVAPDVEVHIVASASTDAGTPDIDVAVLFGARDDFPRDALQLVEERVFPVCSPAFAAAHGLAADPAAITRVPLLHLDSTPRPRWFSWRDWLDAMRIARPRPRRSQPQHLRAGGAGGDRGPGRGARLGGPDRRCSRRRDAGGRRRTTGPAGLRLLDAAGPDALPRRQTLRPVDAGGDLTRGIGPNRAGTRDLSGPERR